MGNQQSSKKDRGPGQIIDYIATHYILTMDFQSLTKLYQKEYCDNLVVLTSNIIEKYFNPLEISYLAQRIKDGVEVVAKGDLWRFFALDKSAGAYMSLFFPVMMFGLPGGALAMILLAKDNKRKIASLTHGA